MVNLYLFKPAQKFRILSNVLFQTTRRILRNVLHTESAMGLAAASRSLKANIAYSATERSLKFSQKTLVKPIRDPEYYKDESQGGFCVFQVENNLFKVTLVSVTLNCSSCLTNCFKVHRFFLMREPSTLEDILRYPHKRYSNYGMSDDNPVVLPDRVDQFRDLLWALYALSVYCLLYTALTCSCLN
jgi:hypothetical protein